MVPVKTGLFLLLARPDFRIPRPSARNISEEYKGFTKKVCGSNILPLSRGEFGGHC